MERIREASEIIAKTLGEQQVSRNEPVRFASWCVAVSTASDDALLLNVFTKELILFGKDETGFLCLSDLAESDLDSIRGSELFNYLSTHWFLAPESHDDKKLVDEVRAVVACMNNPDGIVGYTILTTTDCNARCFYCYEQGLERVNMSRQVALDTAEYIKKTAGKKINLHWFGGEPLFNFSAIDTITDELKKAGIDYRSTMTSNGYLMTDNLIAKATDGWNLKGIQITLDGTEEVYNQRKAYINSKGSAFLRVLDNIEELLKAGIRVAVRLNLDMANADDLYKLTNLLSDRFSMYDKFGVYAHYIFEGENANSLAYSFDDTYAELVKLRKYLVDKGLCHRGIVGNTIKVSHCMADKDSSIVISQSGKLYKCQHIGCNTISCGDIYTGVQNQEVVEYWRKSPEDGAICESCPLYADCVRSASCPDDFDYCPQVIYDEKINRVKNAMLYTYEQREHQCPSSGNLFESC